MQQGSRWRLAADPSYDDLSFEEMPLAHLWPNASRHRRTGCWHPCPKMTKRATVDRIQTEYD